MAADRTSIGVGDNIRGTVLGAVDTITKSGETKNDLLAEKGRREVQDGVANIKGVPLSSSTTSSYPTGAVDPGYDSAHPGHTVPVPGSANQPYTVPANTMPTTSPNQNVHGGGDHSAFPQHHRDDAISNDPDAIAVGQEHTSAYPGGDPTFDPKREAPDSAIPGRAPIGNPPGGTNHAEFGQTRAESSGGRNEPYPGQTMDYGGRTV